MSGDLELAVRAVAAASGLCTAVQRERVEVVAAAKTDRSPVTVADYGSQALVCRLLAEHFPSDGVLAEEASAELLSDGGAELTAALVSAVSAALGAATSLEEVCGWIEHGRGASAARQWILDPVDGTKGFLRGGQYAIALALLEGGELRLGVLGCPNLPCGDDAGCLLLAERGGGAFQVPLSDTSRREKIRVSEADDPSKLVFVESVESAHADHGSHAKICELLGARREPLRMDSQAKYAAVARGDADVYLRLPNPQTPEYRQKAWDHAAGALVVAEAGGRATDAFGKELDFAAGPTLLNNHGVVATSGECHHAVIEAVAEVLEVRGLKMPGKATRNQLLTIGLAALGLLSCGCGPSGDPAVSSRGRTIRVPQDKPTIQAAADAAADGDTVLVAPGKYPGGIVLSGKAITLASHYLTERDGRHVKSTVLGARGKERWGFVLKVEKTVGPGARIIGFTFLNGKDGIACHAPVEIAHNRFTDCKDGIDYEGGGGICRNNVFEKNLDDGIDLDWDCDVVIERNLIRDNRDDGIEIRFYPYKGAKTLQIVVRENVISGNGEDGIQVIDHPGPSNRVLRVERNLISGTRMAAIGFMDEARTGEDYRAAAMPDRVLIVGNTFLDNEYGLTGGGNLFVLNNVFARTARTALKGCTGGAVVARNLFWKNGRDFHPEDGVQKSGVVAADPKLDEDGRPQAGSACIDAGTALFEWKGERILKASRRSYSGRAPDLGAYEFRRGHPSPKLGPRRQRR